MDIKKLARIVRVGHRIHGDRRRTVKGAGWEFYLAAIHDASRVSHGEVFESEQKEDVVAFLLAGGVQYIAIPMGGANHKARLVTLRFPPTGQ